MEFEVFGQKATVGGNAPVQGEGIFDGYPWYFRARHEHWALAIADVDGDPVQVMFRSQPGWLHERQYGTGPHDASWMPHEEAAECIRRLLTDFRAAKLENDRVRRRLDRED